jgi:uncharacterized phiE125 gp8 family phage protein
MWMPTVVSVAPAIEPVTRDQAKDYLRVDDASLDGQIDSFIKIARADIERITGTKLITQTVIMRAGSFADLDRLPIGPIQSVTEISYKDHTGAEQVLAPAAYEAFGAVLENGIRPAIGSGWPAPQAGEGVIKVTAIAGYGDEATDVPETVLLAMLIKMRGIMDDEQPDLSQLLVNDRIWL